MLRLLAMGDSITCGSDDFQGGYRSVLEALLEQRGVHFEMVGSMRGNSQGMKFPWHEGHPGFRIEHLRVGHASDHSRCAPVAETLERFAPDCVLLLVGTNNLYFDQPEHAYEEWGRLVSSITETGCYPKVLAGTLLPILPGPKPWGSVIPQDVGIRLQRFNALIREGAASLQLNGVRGRVLDMHTTVQSSSDLGPDGVHPTSTVMRRMAERWVDGLTEFFG